jgi:hypothetical protein
MVRFGMAIEEGNNRCGYCDLHLESKLVPVLSHDVLQYGGDNADCNPFKFFRCSHPECNRCYEPHCGYFTKDRQPGGRNEMSPYTQERCGRHDRVLFMHIGRVGHGRRFRCPCDDCEGLGRIVAENVADVNELEQDAATTTSDGRTSDEKKEVAELSTFTEFAIAANLPVISQVNAKPPRPDIRCLIDGDEYWFELGRITDTKLAKAITAGWRTDLKPFSFAQKEPFLRIIEKKGAKRYETSGRLVDLVLHFDQQPPDRTALQRHLREHAHALNDLRKRGPFSRIWIYDKWSKSVLWQSTTRGEIPLLDCIRP